jgi:hypothetical protein
MRHLISGVDCAIAGAATVAAPATPIPVTLIKSRRFIEFPSLGDVIIQPSFEVWTTMKHLPADFHASNGLTAMQKARPLARPGLPSPG